MLDTGTTLQVSASDPCHRDQSSCGCVSLRQKRTLVTLEGEKVNHQRHRGVCVNTITSSTPTNTHDTRLQGYSAGECRHSHRCSQRARSRIRFSQRRHRGHPRCLCQPWSSLTIPCSIFSFEEPGNCHSQKRNQRHPLTYNCTGSTFRNASR